MPRHNHSDDRNPVTQTHIDYAIATSTLLTKVDPHHVCEETARQYLVQYFPELTGGGWGDAYARKLLSNGRNELIQFNVNKIKAALHDITYIFKLAINDRSYMRSLNTSIAYTDGTVLEMVHNLFHDIHTKRLQLSRENFLEWLLGGKYANIGDGAPYSRADDLYAVILHCINRADRPIANVDDAANYNFRNLVPTYVNTAKFMCTELSDITDIVYDATYGYTARCNDACPRALQRLNKYIRLFSIMFYVATTNCCDWDYNCRRRFGSSEFEECYQSELDPMDVLGSLSKRQDDGIKLYRLNTSHANLAKHRVYAIDDETARAVFAYVIRARQVVNIGRPGAYSECDNCDD